jgi:hypothetical protein
MIELAFGAAHPERLNSIVGEHLGASTGVSGALPKQLLAFREKRGRESEPAHFNLRATLSHPLVIHASFPYPRTAQQELP